MKRNLDPVISITKKYKIIRVNNLLKIKMEFIAIQLVALLKRKFHPVHFSGDF